MRFLHSADLHLGKSLYRFSLIEDQRHQLFEILRIAVEERVDALFLSGDIFDRPIPPLDAVSLWDEFLNEAGKLELALFIISGNHDSPIRLSYAAKFLASHRFYLAAQFDGTLPSIHFEKNGEASWVSLLPYVKNSQLRSFLDRPDERDGSVLMEEFLEREAKQSDSLPSILLAHQWLVERGGSSEESESELPQLGQVEILNAEVFERYDHVACGHLHRPQKVNEKIQYSGSPLAYSASEAGQEKSLSLICVEDQSIRWERIPLKPLRPLRLIHAYYDELWEDSILPPNEDYLMIRLRDSSLPPQAMQRLQARFPRLCHLAFETGKREGTAQKIALPKLDSTEDLFRAFFLYESGKEMSESQLAFLREALEEDVE